MTSLYSWLLFTHLTSLAVFLFAHGISAVAAFAARSNLTDSRWILQISQRSWFVAGPAILLLIASGIWMGFMGSWWGRGGWIWASIIVLVALIVSMNFLSRPFYQARSSSNDEEYKARLASANPMAMTWAAVVGIVVILFLMVFKPF